MCVGPTTWRKFGGQHLRKRMLARPPIRGRLLALGMRWILGVVRPRADEALRAGEIDESLQTEIAEGARSFSVDCQFRREVEAAGTQPASLVDASILHKTT